MRQFRQAAVFDWSGAAGERHKGIALGLCEPGQPPRLIPSPSRKPWSRQEAFGWIEARIEERADLLIGMDVSFGFPFVDSGGFFPGWADSPPDARALWAIVDAMSADEPHLGTAPFLARLEIAAHFRQRGMLGAHYGEDRAGRLRVVERQSRAQGIANPYSSLNLVGAAQVGKASLTAMRLLHRLNGRVPIWPFDPAPERGPMLVEIYSAIAAVGAGLAKGRTKLRSIAALDAALANLGAPATGLPSDAIDDHASDALLTAAWLHRAQADPALWSPASLTPEIARTEGWTFGVA